MSTKQTVAAHVDRNAGDLLALSHWIHQHPEVAWQEHESSAHIADFLESRGFTVSRSPEGIETAFVARKGTGDFQIALCAKYDALPGLGHACGHNIIASASVGAALALAEVAGELDATITVFGTPAEEGGGGKITMLERGVFG